jgi:hypothetical protein
MTSWGYGRCYFCGNPNTLPKHVILKSWKTFCHDNHPYLYVLIIRQNLGGKNEVSLTWYASESLGKLLKYRWPSDAHKVRGTNDLN